LVLILKKEKIIYEKIIFIVAEGGAGAGGAVYSNILYKGVEDPEPKKNI